MAETLDNTAAPVVDEEPGPNLDDLAKWAVDVSKATGQPDVIIPDPTEELPAEQAAAAAPAPVVPKTTEQDTATQATEGRKVLKAKDGVHEIPYARLEESNSARDKAIAEAAEAKKQAEETATKLAEAQAQLEALKQAGEKGTTTAAAAEQTADELEAQIKAIEDGAEALQDEAPWMAEQQRNTAKTMRSLLTGMRQVQSDLASTRKQEQESAEQAQQRVVNEALDATPALRHWQTAKPAFFNAAIEIDNKLRAKTEWANAPLKDRFAEVVKNMVAEYGETILPAGSKPGASPKPKPLPTDATAGVHTLTDLPGGTPTAQNPLEAVEGADPSAIAQKLIQMDNPADIIRWATG